jgi:hypothetical protein
MALSGESQYPSLAQSEQKVVSGEQLVSLFFLEQVFRIFEAPTLHILARHLAHTGNVP